MYPKSFTKWLILLIYLQKLERKLNNKGNNSHGKHGVRIDHIKEAYTRILHKAANVVNTLQFRDDYSHYHGKDAC